MPIGQELIVGLTAANFIVNLDILAATYKVLNYHQVAQQYQVSTQRYQDSMLYLLSNISNKIGGDFIMESKEVMDFSEDIKRLKESLHTDLKDEYTAADLAMIADKIVIIKYLEECNGKQHPVATPGHIY